MAEGDGQVSELTTRTAIVRALRRAGAWTIVTTGVAQAGAPDLLVCYLGRFIALEVKADKGGRVSPQQSLMLRKIEAAGGTAQVVRSVDEALKALIPPAP